MSVVLSVNKNNKFLVVGNSKLAYVQAKILIENDIDVVVIAEHFSDNWNNINVEKRVKIFERKDLEEFDYIIATKNNMSDNKNIYSYSKAMGKQCSIPLFNDTDFQIMYSKKKSNIKLAVKTAITSVKFSEKIIDNLFEYIDESFYKKLETYYELEEYLKNLDIDENYKEKMLLLIGEINEYN